LTPEQLALGVELLQGVSECPNLVQHGIPHLEET
jgi:hypothetical protein